MLTRSRLLAFLFTMLLATPLVAQIAVPNTLVAGTTIAAAALNTNFSTIATHALDRLAGGTISGNIAMDPGITIDGLDLSVALCSSCTATFKDLTLTAPATGLTVNGVNIVNSTGLIPAISSTYFANLSGTNLTGIPLLSTVNAWTNTNGFTGRSDFQVYTETKTALTPAASVTVDLSLGSHFTLSMTTTVTTLTLSNPPTSGKAGAFTLACTGNGTSHPITWPASVKWAGGVAPTITTTNAKVDFFTFLTYDGGTTWFAFVGGQNF